MKSFIINSFILLAVFSTVNLDTLARKPESAPIVNGRVTSNGVSITNGFVRWEANGKYKYTEIRSDGSFEFAPVSTNCDQPNPEAGNGWEKPECAYNVQSRELLNVYDDEGNPMQAYRISNKDGTFNNDKYIGVADENGNLGIAFTCASSRHVFSVVLPGQSNSICNTVTYDVNNGQRLENDANYRINLNCSLPQPSITPTAPPTIPPQNSPAPTPCTTECPNTPVPNTSTPTPPCITKCPSATPNICITGAKCKDNSQCGGMRCEGEICICIDSTLTPPWTKMPSPSTTVYKSTTPSYTPNPTPSPTHTLTPTKTPTPTPKAQSTVHINSTITKQPTTKTSGDANPTKTNTTSNPTLTTTATITPTPTPVISKTPINIRNQMVCLTVDACAGAKGKNNCTANRNFYPEDTVRLSIPGAMIKTTDEKITDDKFYIAECINNADGPCSTGNSALDVKFFGSDNTSMLGTRKYVFEQFIKQTLNGEKIYMAGSTENNAENKVSEFVDVKTADKSKAQPIGLWESILCNDQNKACSTNTTDNKSTDPRFFFALVSPFGKSILDKFGNQGNSIALTTINAMNVFDDVNKKCIGIRWDPYGRVFDAMTLEPLNGVKVSLFKKDDYGSLFLESQLTQDGGQFSFFVGEGIYTLHTSTYEGYTQAQKSDLHPRASEFYDSIYYEGENITQRAREVPHRNIPLKPLDIDAAESMAKNIKPQLVGKTQKYLDSNHKNYYIKGEVTHPITKITIYAIDKNSKERTRKIAQTVASKSGAFSLMIPLTDLKENEIIDDKIDLLKESVRVPLSLKRPKGNLLNQWINDISNWFSPRTKAGTNQISTVIDKPVPTTLKGKIFNLEAGYRYFEAKIVCGSGFSPATVTLTSEQPFIIDNPCNSSTKIYLEYFDRGVKRFYPQTE